MLPDKFKKPYNPSETEALIYKKWEESGYFNPDNLPNAESREPFTIILPPPNVTGTLHVGHAYEDTLQDIVIRFNRMQGKKALWLPGTDSAAIATQARVERNIQKEEGKTRHDLGREELVRRIQEFAKNSENTILSQVRRMGASLDWSRYAYTLDEKRSRAVFTAFKRMYEKNLIYKGNRIVNWDPKGQTTISDDEIAHQEETTKFYYLKYGPFTIGTARPETKFGDKYVVMHPDDRRYKEYTGGEKIELEWINGPITATVIKDAAIDMEFGTGVMTITPWHSQIDFEIAERHNLDKEQIIDRYGKLLPVAGEFAGMKIADAREKIVEKLKQKGLLAKVDENYIHNVATSERTGAIIEPQIMEQWFVAVEKPFSIPHSEIPGIESGSETTLKALMRSAVESGAVDMPQEGFRKTYFHWVENLHDWCISRQIWFGHRIPVWYCLRCKKEKVGADIQSRWFLIRHGETEFNKARRIQGWMNSHLTEEGRHQVEAAAQQLKNEKIALIISSDLIRCKETSEIIAQTIGAPVIYDERLREKSYGSAEGILYEEYEKKFGTRLSYDTRISDEETYKEVEERVREAFLHHRTSHDKKNVIIVSHGGTLRMLMKHIKDINPEESMGQQGAKNAEILALDILTEPCAKCGGDLYEQDPDVLDTWFSSALWTFSTLGWPEETFDLKEFHPTSFMSPAYEILQLWVSRMILMSTFHLGQVPFKKVLIHGLVRAKDGRKFSKSLNNGVDPLDMVEKYGADALRMGLIVGSSIGSDIAFDEQKVRGYKLFANKLWNIARFVIENGTPNMDRKRNQITTTDQTLVEEFNDIAKEVTEDMEKYHLHLAAEKIYHYIWHRFADEIIEESKSILKSNDEVATQSRQDVLIHLLTGSLKLLHPFMPFITEEIWQNMPPYSRQSSQSLLMIEAWPSVS